MPRDIPKFAVYYKVYGDVSESEKSQHRSFPAIWTEWYEHGRFLTFVEYGLRATIEDDIVAMQYMIEQFNAVGVAEAFPDCYYVDRWVGYSEEAPHVLYLTKAEVQQRKRKRRKRKPEATVDIIVSETDSSYGKVVVTAPPTISPAPLQFATGDVEHDYCQAAIWARDHGVALKIASGVTVLLMSRSEFGLLRHPSLGRLIVRLNETDRRLRETYLSLARGPRICPTCEEQHTSQCFLDTAAYLENVPDDFWSPTFLHERPLWIRTLRVMANDPYKPQHQQWREQLALTVVGVTHLR